MDVSVGSKYFIAGLPYAVQDFSFSATGNNLLKILISPNQLDFCILEKNSNRLLYLQPYQFTAGKQSPGITDALETIFSENEILKTGFSEKSVGILTPDFNIFPASLAAPALTIQWKESFTRLKESDILLTDEIQHTKAVNVFAFPGEIKNVLDRHFRSYKLQHALTSQIRYLIGYNSGKNVYCAVQAGCVQIIYLNEKQLYFANIFTYQSPEDFIYFLLATYKQLQLDPEKVKVTLLGQIEKDSALFQLLYKYIRNIEFGKLHRDLKFNDDYPFAGHFYFSLFCQ